MKFSLKQPQVTRPHSHPAIVPKQTCDLVNAGVYNSVLLPRDALNLRSVFVYYRWMHWHAYPG